jgi:hypothetical protein
MPASPCAWAEALYFRPLHTIRFSQEEGVRQRVSIKLIMPFSALVQLNGDNFLFYNKRLGDLNVEKFMHKHPRSVDGVNDVWHAYPHSSRNLHDIGIARKLDWRLYKRLF